MQIKSCSWLNIHTTPHRHWCLIHLSAYAHNSCSHYNRSWHDRKPTPIIATTTDKTSVCTAAQICISNNVACLFSGCNSISEGKVGRTAGLAWGGTSWQLFRQDWILKVYGAVHCGILDQYLGCLVWTLCTREWWFPAYQCSHRVVFFLGSLAYREWSSIISNGVFFSPVRMLYAIMWHKQCSCVLWRSIPCLLLFRGNIQWWALLVFRACYLFVTADEHVTIITQITL